MTTAWPAVAQGQNGPIAAPGTLKVPAWSTLAPLSDGRGSDAGRRALIGGSDRGGDRTRGPRIKSALLYH